MKINVSTKLGNFSKRVLNDFSKKMFEMLENMPLEKITVQKICDACTYPRSTFYNYFEDIYDLMDYCWYALMQDMDMEKYVKSQCEQSIEEIFSLLYEYLNPYSEHIYRILSKNGLESRCISSLRSFMKNQIKQMVHMCPATKDFLLREDVMVDYYALVIEMLLEKCFFNKNPLNKKDALQAIQVFFENVERKACEK